jgi:hypothetical protein
MILNLSTYGTDPALFSVAAFGTPLSSSVGSSESGVENPFVVVSRDLPFGFDLDLDLPSGFTTFVFGSLFLAILKLSPLPLCEKGYNGCLLVGIYIPG